MYFQLKNIQQKSKKVLRRSYANFMNKSNETTNKKNDKSGTKTKCGALTELILADMALLSLIISNIFWFKARTSYYVNNWIYTTNHKRIAVNYFWFVILSGIVGMVLATIIRLEFAYPGVGILAGDSIQYLSLASAHGVIMVFFMIMPLLFGAFANFLLPTQLGVHDVAFPRLNSAAFWFLPGGLLMLCQLVCVDRRYQRMNCFNIRETESLLKRRFFTDLINTKDHHTLINKTAIGLRYRINQNTTLSNNLELSYNFGINLNLQNRNNSYTNFFFEKNINQYNNILTFSKNSHFFNRISYFNFTNIFFFINSFFFLFLEKTFFVFNLSNELTTNSIFFFIKNIWFVFEKIFFIIYNFFYNLISNFFFFFFKLPKNFLILIFDFIISSFFYFTDSIVFKIEFVNFLKAYFDYLKNSLTSSNLYLIFNFLINNNKMFSSSNNTAVYDIFNILLKYLDKRVDFYLNDNSNFDWEVWRFVINYDFKNNDFLFNLNTLWKISLNNWFACFSWKNLKYRTEAIDTYWTHTFPPFENFKSRPITYKRLWDKTLSKDFWDSFMLEIYSLFFFLLSVPLSIVNFFLYLMSDHYLELMVKKFLNDSFFWYLNTLNDTDIWKKKITNEDVRILIDAHIKIFDNIIPFFFRYAIIIKGFFSSLYSVWENILFYFTNISLIFFDVSKEVIESFFFSFKNYFNFSQNIFFSSNFFSNLEEIAHSFRHFFFNMQNYSLKKSLLTKKNLKQFNQYASDSRSFVEANENFLLNNEELSNNSRFLKFNYPVFKYDYKSGDYFPKLYKDLYHFLMPSYLSLTSGLRMPSWFFSAGLLELLENTSFLGLTNLDKKNNLNNLNLFLSKSNKISHTDSFYNFFFILNNQKSDLNFQWISTNSLNSKFNRLFLTSSLQQRLYNNWRTLKFTREAWRCKMLLARHQKTLFRRYSHEDGVFWSIERNAKDLIPGWAMITPFSSRTRYTAVGKTDIGLMGVLLVLNSSIISSANFLVTYRYLSTLNNRKMRDARAFFTEAVMVASWMMILANPMLVIGIIMLISDRHWQTSFFDYSGGGDTVLFQHMFWFFGHPEVYIIIIPTFGFTNTMISYYLKKRISARASLLYSLYTIAFLGFFVWGHHMYMVGLSHTTRMLFSTLTVMISVPAATKIMHWCVTTANSAFAMELPLLFTFTFIFFFVSGGISGMCVAHTGMDVLFHDTFYVIGHFHVMLAGGAMFASFGAFYFYFPAIFGVKYSRIYAYLHYSYYLVGQLMTVIPMFWLGYAGMPRRVLDYPAAFGGWHSVISAGHMLNVAGLIAFFIMIFDSLRQAKAATRNTFGISRYNTRLNFYLYEISRLIYIQQKSLFFFRMDRLFSLKLNDLNFLNFEPYESVLFSYSLSKK